LTRLNYGDVSDIEYVTADASLVLSPAQQSLAVQAVSIFRELYNWTDSDTESDNIDALVASTIAALLDTTIPPKENMNNRVTLFPYMGVIAAGNPFLFTTAGAWQQNAATNGSLYQIDGVILAAGAWTLRTFCYKQNSAGILKVEFKETATGSLISSDTEDLYSAATTLSRPVMNNFTLSVNTECYILVSANGKNASSSNYALPIISFGLERA